MKESRLTLLPIILNKYKEKIKIDVNEGTVTGLNVYENHKGYLTINFWHEGRTKYYRIHEIVAFVGGLSLLNNTVNHINGNKKDNRLSNLEAITSLENHKKANDTKSFLYGEANHSSKLTLEQVRNIRRNYSGAWGEMTKLAKNYKVDGSTISNILNNKIWKDTEANA